MRGKVGGCVGGEARWLGFGGNRDMGFVLFLIWKPASFTIGWLLTGHVP